VLAGTGTYVLQRRPQLNLRVERDVLKGSVEEGRLPGVAMLQSGDSSRVLFGPLDLRVGDTICSQDSQTTYQVTVRFVLGQPIFKDHLGIDLV
jgi:hypothetical protein